MTKRRARKQRSSKVAKRPPLEWMQLGRWLLGLGLFALMGVAGAWGVMQLRDPHVLPLKVVRIDGQLKYLKRADIEKAVGPVIQGNFFTLDVGAVREAAHRLPWVDQVSVRRVWPSTLQMWVREQVPSARWGRQELVNPLGLTFKPSAGDIPAGLPKLSGPAGSAPEVIARYRELQPRFSRLGLDLRQLRLDARLAWRIEFGNGLKLQLGATETGRRVDRFVQVYPQLAEKTQRRLLEIDLRYSNGFAVRWEDVPGRQSIGDRKSGGKVQEGRGQV